MNTHSNSHPAHRNHHESVGKHPDRLASKARQTEEPSDEYAGGFSSILRRMPIALGVTALSGLLAVTALCLAAFLSSDPTALLRPCTAAALVVASLCGGITAGKLNPSTPVTAGLLCGTATALLLTAAALLTGSGGGLLHWGLRLSVIPVHLAGGIMTRPRRKLPTHTAGNHPSHR